MACFRRHLASMGLVVIVTHLAMQVLVPAALCCRALAASSKATAEDCCPAGAHAGGICPMHAGRAAKQKASSADCHAQSTTDLHQLYLPLTTGGVVPSLVQLIAPIGSEAAPTPAQPSTPTTSLVPLGPPPRA